MSAKNKCTICKKIVRDDDLVPCVLCKQMCCLNMCDKCGNSSCYDAHENICVSKRLLTIRDDVKKALSNFPHNGDIHGLEKVLILEGILKILSI